MYLRIIADDARFARPNPARRTSFQANHLKVRMFNVGSGECMLIVFPGQRAWLIDCGSSNGDPDNNTLGVQMAAHLRAEGLTLEAIVPSHPHKDHVGGFAPLLRANPPLADPVTLYRSGDGTWNGPEVWLADFWPEIHNLGNRLIDVPLTNQRREIDIEPGVTVVLFAGSGQRKYTSLFVQIRFHEARLLFTGDVHCGYERRLILQHGPGDFRADILKITHHGSSSGTSRCLVETSQYGLAIASDTEHTNHILEKDTMDRLNGPGGRPGRPRRVYETVVDGDILLKTDGQGYGGGVLYELITEDPGTFADDLGASTVDADALVRGEGNYPDCVAPCLDGV